MATSSEQEHLAEYESQLADVEALIQVSPDDPSLQSLKSDLLELIHLTRQAAAASVPPVGGYGDPPPPAARSALEQALEAAVETSIGKVDGPVTATNPPTPLQPAAYSQVTAAAADVAETIPNGDMTEEGDASKKKAKKQLKEFEVPANLIPLDTDTEAEKNRKRRALKALKNKWREQKKEIESDKKQKTWQSFQKKRKTKDKSIFATHEEDDAKVGVVSMAGRQLTEFGERKRHKHDI